MKFSENWLRSHVPTDATREQLAATLTAIGLEVEDVTELGAGLGSVVVGRILSAERHPEADRLQVCSVDAGLGAPLQIVCGAPNARAGLVAPLALVGAVVGGTAIKAAKLRGVESNGMLCSAKELGLDNDASGLMELPVDAPVGQALTEYLALPDATMELKLTPNRADCFSIRGIAYDVAAACNSKVVAFDAQVVPATTDRQLPVTLAAGADAPRYCGRVVENVDATASTPVWMAERLRRSGIRPVSLLVDITQYVMLEIGQPMHAFDLVRLQGPVGVRRARAGETLTLLDGRDVLLDPEFLAITDADRVVALAGVMGGFDTRVTDATQHIFLEAAHFAPAAIMGRGRRLGLHTDAGHRFERGVDPTLPRLAIELATRLVLQFAGGAAGPVVEAALPEFLATPAPVHLRRARIARILGITLEDAEVVRIFVALGMCVDTAEDGWHVTPSSRRFDIAIEEDLIEELARIHGYDRIPTTLPGGASRIAMPTETQLDEISVRRQMVARDYLETINYSFVDAGLLAHWGTETPTASGTAADVARLLAGTHSGDLFAGKTVPLANPLSAELAVMRPALLPGLVATLQRNVARQAGRVRLFELGKVFAAPEAVGDAPRETQRIAGVLHGETVATQWGEPARKADFHDLKGDLESLAAAANAPLEFWPSRAAHGHPGRSADVYRDDRRIGWIGQVHPRLARALDLDGEVLAFEIDLAPLVARDLPHAGDVSKFPSVRRDLALVVADDVPWAALEHTVRATAGELLRDVLVFDRYVGEGVEPGFKSLAMGLILQDNSRTLTDRDVDAVVAGVVQSIARDHGATIRGTGAAA